MRWWLSLVLLLGLAPLAICWGLWALFALLALLPPRKIAAGKGERKIDILIPAHNERLLLPRLLESLTGQTAAGLSRRGQTLVIADHCSDDTATLARAGGATVLERNSGPRGKPAALRDGIALLQGAAPDHAIVIIDADCTVTGNLLESLAGALDAGHRVAQAAYILDAGPVVAGQKLHTPALIAFALKNLIRPKGMGRIGLPTQLFGTGMCFHPEVLGKISFADHLTEDLKISHDLLLAGIGPRFLPEAVVRSPLPEERSAMTTQKLRWETGQVQTWAKLPGMLVRLVARGHWRSAVSLVDWSAPPVALAVGGWLVLAGVATGLAAAGWVPWAVLLPFAVTLCLLVGYIILGTLQIAGAAAVVSLFVAVPRFLLWKIALYVRMISGRGAKTWDRTPRGSAAESAAAASPPVVEQGKS